MSQLSSTGQQVINDVAQRHGFSRDAVVSMLESVVNGNGSMAQFDHPEFGGSGQWMQGGMTMVSDMFNQALKSRIDDLCAELSGLAANEPGLGRDGSFQSQSQGSPRSVRRRGEDDDEVRPGSVAQQRQGASGPVGPVSLFVSPASSTEGRWWPAQLGAPTSSGAQNGVSYAYFAAARRLAIKLNGRVTVYDTLDHEVGGFSQQQSTGGSLSFHSQHGLVDVASLPIAPVDESRPQMPGEEKVQRSSSSSAAAQIDSSNVFASIEKLADLHAKGFVSDEEFSSKKKELLARV